MEPTFQIIGILVSIALGLAATIIGSLVLSKLAGIDKRLDAHEASIKFLTGRKETCQTEFVTVEQFVRESGYTRNRLDTTVELLKQLSGQFESVSQIPQIAGQVATQTVREILREVLPLLQKKG